MDRSTKTKARDASRSPVRKASAKARRRAPVGRSVRFDFDRHGAQSAFVPVRAESTREASDLIAAAIQQSWDALEDE